MDIQNHPMGGKNFQIRCWKGSWSISWQNFGNWRGAANFLGMVVLISAMLIGGQSMLKGRFVTMTLWWLAIVPGLVVLISLIWNMPKSAHAIYQEAIDQKDRELQDKQTELGKMAAEMEKVKAQIQTDELRAAKKKEIGDKLGAMRILLGTRADEIRSMGCFEYADKYPNTPDSEYDVITNGILEAVTHLLENYYSKTEAAIFHSKSSFKPSTVPNSWGSSFTKAQRHHDVVENLRHYEHQLDEILKIKQLPS